MAAPLVWRSGSEVTRTRRRRTGACGSVLKRVPSRPITASRARPHTAHEDRQDDDTRIATAHPMESALCIGECGLVCSAASARRAPRAALGAAHRARDERLHRQAGSLATCPHRARCGDGRDPLLRSHSRAAETTLARRIGHPSCAARPVVRSARAGDRGRTTSSSPRDPIYHNVFSVRR